MTLTYIMIITQGFTVFLKAEGGQFSVRTTNGYKCGPVDQDTCLETYGYCSVSDFGNFINYFWYNIPTCLSDYSTPVIGCVDDPDSNNAQTDCDEIVEGQTNCCENKLFTSTDTCEHYMAVNTVQEWELVNDDLQQKRSHPFHIHVNHVQIVDFYLVNKNGQKSCVDPAETVPFFQIGDWRDVLTLLPGKGQQHILSLNTK